MQDANDLDRVGCEFMVKRQWESGKDRDNAAAKRDDQAM
jgi:hypothetical protein